MVFPPITAHFSGRIDSKIEATLLGFVKVGCWRSFDAIRSRLKRSNTCIGYRKLFRFRIGQKFFLPKCFGLTELLSGWDSSPKRSLLEKDLGSLRCFVLISKITVFIPWKHDSLAWKKLSSGSCLVEPLLQLLEFSSRAPFMSINLYQKRAIVVNYSNNIFLLLVFATS